MNAVFLTKLFRYLEGELERKELSQGINSKKKK